MVKTTEYASDHNPMVFRNAMPLGLKFDLINEIRPVRIEGKRLCRNAGVLEDFLEVFHDSGFVSGRRARVDLNQCSIVRKDLSLLSFPIDRRRLRR